MRYLFVLLLLISFCGCNKVEHKKETCVHHLQLITNTDGVTRIWCHLCKHYVRGFVAETPYEKCDSVVLGKERAESFCKGIPYTYFMECDFAGIELIYYHNIFVGKNGVLFLDIYDDDYLQKLEQQGYLRL